MEKSDRLIELLEILKRAECIFIEQWKILYKEDEIDMEDIFSIFYKGSNNCEIQVKKLTNKKRPCQKKYGRYTLAMRRIGQFYGLSFSVKSNL